MYDDSPTFRGYFKFPTESGRLYMTYNEKTDELIGGSAHIEFNVGDTIESITYLSTTQMMNTIESGGSVSFSINEEVLANDVKLFRRISYDE
jgi:hypothetical protein